MVKAPPPSEPLPPLLRRISDFEDVVASRWRFSKTISLDSLIVLVITVVSGIVFLVTMNSKIEQQAKDIDHVKEQTKAGIENVQKSVERVEMDQKERATRMERENAERSARLERDQAERAVRLELAIKETNQLVQSVIVPRLQR